MAGGPGRGLGSCVRHPRGATPLASAALAFGSPFAWPPRDMSSSPRTAAWSSTTRTAAAATRWRTISSASPATSSGWRKAPRPQPCTSTPSSRSLRPRGGERPGCQGPARLPVDSGSGVGVGGGGVASEGLRACVGPFAGDPTRLGCVFPKGLSRCRVCIGLLRTTLGPGHFRGQGVHRAYFIRSWGRGSSCRCIQPFLSLQGNSAPHAPLHARAE